MGSSLKMEILIRKSTLNVGFSIATFDYWRVNMTQR